MNVLDFWRQTGWTFCYEQQRGAVVRRGPDDGDLHGCHVVCEGIQCASVGKCIAAALNKEQSNDAG